MALLCIIASMIDISHVHSTSSIAAILYLNIESAREKKKKSKK